MSNGNFNLVLLIFGVILLILGIASQAYIFFNIKQYGLFAIIALLLLTIPDLIGAWIIKISMEL